MPFGRKSPLEALVLPGVILAYKYSQFRQRRREAASRRVTERELSALHHKIDKLLTKLEESEPEPPTSQEDECVICINARATMQTSPCGHRVVCRRCFVKTIQSAVAQRLLPLRCVICRARVNRLTSSSGTWRIQESASSYSMGSKSWSSGVPPSASSYSMSDAHSAHHFHGNNRATTSGAAAAAAAAPAPPPSAVETNHHNNHRVSQSASLYSMSSGTSSFSSASSATNYSKPSSASSCGLIAVDASSSSSPATSPGSPYLTYTPLILNNHLAPPKRSSFASGASSQSSTSSSSSSSFTTGIHLHHHHHSSCPIGCSGAIPRKPLHANGAVVAVTGSSGYTSSTTNTYPGRRHTKGRIADLQNRLPPIKEFRSPAKVPHPSPVHISNPRFRYSSYTKSATSTHEMVPLLKDPPSQESHRPLNILVTSSLNSPAAGHKQSLLGNGLLSAKISPIISKSLIPKNGFVIPTANKLTASKITKDSNNSNIHNNNNYNNKNCNNKKNQLNLNANLIQNSSSSSSNNKQFPLFSHINHKEKADNKKNETAERKKKEEKLKIKADKEARKEEKRIAKEEERMAKIMAKEEKKKVKKEAKELLLGNECNKK